LTGWFASGFSVAEPPLDFDCILIESLWFNRFNKKETGQSFGRYLTHQKAISNGSPFSISDVVKKSPPNYNTKLTFLDEAKMRAKYDANMSKVLLSIIECIPLHWRAAIHSKVREPFLPNEWIVEKKYVLRTRPLDFICHIAQCLSHKVSAIKFTINSKSAMISRIHSESLITLSKAHIVKASDTNALSRRPSSIIGLPTHSNLDNDALFYNGLYADQKSLLSRLSWLTNNKSIIPFHQFSIQERYRSVNDSSNVAID
jgi:hypothetical protein